MRKSLILALTALGGGASYAADVSEIGRDPATIDPATWRWRVSSILADQAQLAEPIQSASAANFEQKYSRYSSVGQLQRQK